MADYDFGATGSYIFDTGTGQYVLNTQNGIANTLTDQDGGSPNFEVGEALFFDVGGSPFGVGDFAGSLTIGGADYPALDVGGGQFTINLSGSDQSILPQSFALTDLNTASFPVCFAAGTLIATPSGERAVETLEIGDRVVTADGRTVPVKWVGRQTLHRVFTPAGRFAPVRVAAGALGEGLPHSDLVLTADHALIIDGLAINAGALVNGSTIINVPGDDLDDRVTYYHVETDDHDVILANGVSAETYVDYVQRRVFDNYQDYLDLYGEESTISEMDMPRVSSARLVPPALRARLNGLAAA